MIDDDPHMHRIVGIYLQNKPYEIINVHSGRMALHKLEEEEFDLILTDIQMPGMGGIELVQAIKARYPALPIIVISAFDADQFKKVFSGFNRVQIIAKPFDQHRLIALIDRCFDGTEK